MVTVIVALSLPLDGETDVIQGLSGFSITVQLSVPPPVLLIWKVLPVSEVPKSRVVGDTLSTGSCAAVSPVKKPDDSL